MHMLLPLTAVLMCLIGACAPGVNVPRPNAMPSRPVPPAATSTIRMPISIDISTMLDRVEAMVPRRIAATDDYTVIDRNAIGDIGLRFEATRDPLQIELRNNRLVATSRVRYWIEIAQRVTKPIVGGSFWQRLGSCGRGEALREVQVGIDTDITFGTGWQLTSNTTVRPPSFTHQCRMTFLKVNVTDRVATAFRQALDRAAATVDEHIAHHGNFRPLAERLWSQLQRPVALDSGLVLAMNPTGVGVLTLEGRGRKLQVTLGITAQPLVTAGASSARSTALTALASSKLPEGLHVSVDAVLSFEEINRQLARRLAGTTHVVEGRSIRVDSASAYASGDRVVLSLALSGGLKGAVHLVGTPRYDPKSATLSIEDLDYSLETKDALLNVADWLYHEGFRTSIAAKARFALHQSIAQTRVMLERSLHRDLAPGVRMSATIGSVRPVDVFVTSASLIARVVIDGFLRLEVQ